MTSERTRRIAIFVSAALWGLSAHAAEATAERTEALYGVCVSCHGAHGEGRTALDAPRIGDLDVAYIVTQLTAFREGGRGAHPDDTLGHAMGGSVQGLTDDMIASLAEHIAGLSAPPRAPGETVEGGAAAYATCAACHGADGRGLPAVGAPDLLHQEPAYLTLQLRNYRDGVRGGAGSPPLAATMAQLVQSTDDAQIDVLVAHISSLRPALEPTDAPPVTASIEEGMAAFADIYTVATHPRCMNCHPDADTPYQTDDSLPHSMGITRHSPQVGLHCSTCHAPSGMSDAPMPPADPVWSMPPRSMAFENRTPAQLCAQLKDPAINGGRSLEALRDHVQSDHLLITSWHSGRQPPPITHEELVDRVTTWGAAGGPCPE